MVTCSCLFAQHWGELHACYWRGLGTDGRYRFNDFHKAAGGEKRHKPADWLRLKSTQEFIEEIRKEISSVQTAGSPLTE